MIAPQYNRRTRKGFDVELALAAIGFALLAGAAYASMQHDRAAAHSTPVPRVETIGAQKMPPRPNGG
jgi:hypothetical protein